MIRVSERLFEAYQPKCAQVFSPKRIIQYCLKGERDFSPLISTFYAFLNGRTAGSNFNSTIPLDFE